MNKYYFFFSFLFLFFSCSTNRESGSINALKVSLTETFPSFEEIFSNIKIISLETNEASLFKQIDKLYYFQDLFYILDATIPALFVYDSNGNYIRNIGKIGNGPGEYQQIYDFVIDKEQTQINLLSPFGTIYIYDLMGNYIEGKQLPDQVPNYHNMICLSSDILLTFSSTIENANSLSLISKDSMEFIEGFWEKHLLIDLYANNPFYEYNESIFFSSGLYNTVYVVNENGLNEAYNWDFGKITTNIDEYKFSTNYEKDFNSEYKEFRKSVTEEKYPYVLTSQNQNDQYYYTGILIADKRKHILFDKRENNYLFFEKTKEGGVINPLFFSNQFIIGTMKFDNRESYLKSSIIDSKHKTKIGSYLEDDNPLLIIYEF